MNLWCWIILFSIFFSHVSVVTAQEADSTSDGVLVSPSNHVSGTDPSSNEQRLEQMDTNGEVPKTDDSVEHPEKANVSDDAIVIKSRNAIMLQITQNMKLTADQSRSIERVIEDTIVNIRNLQLSLENGRIDGRTMYDRRKAFIKEENQKLSHIFTSDQMKSWMNIVNQ